MAGIVVYRPPYGNDRRVDLVVSSDATVGPDPDFAPTPMEQDELAGVAPDYDARLAANDKPAVRSKKLEDPQDPDEEAQVAVPKLPAHQIDIPEEPEQVNVTVLVFNVNTQAWEAKDLGPLLLVPTGCDNPTLLSPYENSVFLKSALPRDKEKDANLYQMYQANAWASREWIRANLDEDMNGPEIDKQIADDVPFILAVQGKPDPSGAGVAQTPGVQGAGGGSNNGAPLPPGPGPGRGNKFQPGDGLANAAPASPAAPGSPVPGATV